MDTSGSYQKGFIESENLQLASEQLRSKRLWVVELKDPQQSIWTRELSAPKVKKDDFTHFCRQLATMYSAGVNLVEAIEIVARQTSSKPLKNVLGQISQDMKSGSSFSTAAAAHPRIFNTVFVHMIEAGEASGNLDEMLRQVATMFEKERNTREKVKSAMIYPVVMMIAITLVIIFMMVFVVPTYMENFLNLGIELPLPTRIVIACSDFLVAYWHLLLVLVLLLWVFSAYYRKSVNGRHMIDVYKLKVPIFGTLWHKQAIARFSRTFCSLQIASVPMLQILTIISKVVGNEAIGRVLVQARENISGGHSIIEPMRSSKLFPPMVLEMMAAGERTGTLDIMLDKLAEYYESDVDLMADRMKALIEPLLIVAMTVAVGIIVLAIMLPSFSLMDNMG